MARKTEQIYRDACRRSHRILANYLALVAWRDGLEGVCVERKHLLKYLSLDAMRDQRVEWLKEDIKRLFPYVESRRDWVYGGTNAFIALFIARRPFPPDGLPPHEGFAWDTEGLRKTKFRIRKVSLPSENRIVGALAAAAAGIRTL